jgi:hypothetical protein
MKNLNFLWIVIYVYLIVAHVFTLWFWYDWSQHYNFLSTMLIGPFVAEFKGLFFPFFI